VVHRDLALRNLLVTGDGKYIVKVSDLGLSRAVESSYYKSEGKSIPIKWSAPVFSRAFYLIFLGSVFAG
jgi:serine/threonine protein kinase